MKRLLAAVLLVAACSGDDAKAEYLDKAEAACQRANAELAEARRQQPTSAKDVPAYVDRLLGIARGTSQTLTGLQPPADDRAEIKAKVLDPLAAQLAAGEAYSAEVKRVAASGDQLKLLQLLSKAPTQTRADIGFMRDYGFDECAKAADTGATAS